MSRGIDISHNNSAINWSAVKDAGIEFAIVRFRYGQVEDRNFKANIEGAAGVGLPVGIYYFSMPGRRRRRKKRRIAVVRWAQRDRPACLFWLTEYASGSSSEPDTA